MNGFDPAKASPADAHKIIAQVAKVLGLDESATHDDIDKTLQALFGIQTGAQQNEAAARRQLTATQRKIVDEGKCSAVGFLVLSAARRAGRL